MKLKIRYENKILIVEVDVEEMWLMLSLTSETELTREEKEVRVQEDFDIQFNRPDYNNWHKHNRHIGNIKLPFRKERDELLDVNPMEYIPDNSQEEERNRNYEYEDLCEKLRQALKPEYAEALIAVELDMKTIQEYAYEMKIGIQAMYKRVQRAKKKRNEVFINSPF